MTDKASIEISLLNENDIPEISNFYNSVHHRGRTPEKFRWEFINNPRLPAIYVVAKDTSNGKIVGTQSAIPTLLVDVNGEVTLTAKSEDTLVHTDYRGLDIFNRMYNLLFAECQKQNIKIIWGFTTAQKPFSKLKFEMPYSISQSTMIFTPLKAYQYLKVRNLKKGYWASFKTMALSIISKIKSIRRYFEKFPSDLEFSILDNTTPFSNETLISSILSMNKDSFLIHQDLDYLTWRINKNPYHQSFFGVNFFKKGEPQANILFNHHTDGVWYLIQDLYASHLSAKERVQILNQAVAELTKSKIVHMIRTWDFCHNNVNKEYVSVKKKLGFVHVKKGSLFVWKYLDPTVTLRPENFILSRIASEGTI